MNKRSLLLINRHARRGKESWLLAIQCLQARGFDLIEQSTEDIKSVSECIKQYNQQVDLVIVGGGDGTLNAALEGLIDTQLPLGIIPLGTANDLARTIKIPNSVPEACDVIAQGHTQKIDLGCVNGKYFLNVASLGLSAEITRRLTAKVKRRWGKLAYAITAIQTIWGFKPFAAEIKANKQSFSVKTMQIAVGNGRYYGGGMIVNDNAAINDKRLDLYSLEIYHWWEIIKLLPAIKEGQYANRNSVRILQEQEIEIYTYQKSKSINTDGELTSQTPAKFQVIPQALTVFVPLS